MSPTLGSPLDVHVPASVIDARARVIDAPARGVDAPASVIEMIAHCIFHQTPRRERARCQECGGDLSPINEIWYCSQCLREREVEDCPICIGRPWR